MPLDWQSVFIPFDAGIDENTHPKLVKLQVPLELENVVFTQEMALSKRNGFTFINTSYWSPPAGSFLEISFDGPLRELFSTGDELCAVAARRLFALNEEQGIWYDRGPVSPFTGDQQNVFVDDRSWFATDSYTEGNYALYAGRWYRHTSDAEWHGVQFRATSFDGSKTFAPVDVHRTTVVTVDRPHGPKCAACGVTDVDRQLLAMVGYDGDYTPTQDASFQIYSYALSTPHLPPTAVVTTASLWFDSYTATGASAGVNNATYATRTYDIIEAPGGDYIYAYVNTDQDIVLVRRDAAHVSKATSTIAGTFTRVALHHDGNILYLLAVADASGGTREVQAFTRNISTLGTLNGPVNLRTLTGASSTTVDAQNADHLGVVTSSAEVLWTYSVIITVPTTTFRNEQRQCFRTSTTTITGLSTEVPIYNCLGLAKPFSKLGRFYLPCTIGPSFAAPGEGSTIIYRYPAPGWNAAVVLDLDKNLPVENVSPEDPQTGGATIVGIYHIGVAPNLANHDTAVSTGLFANRNQFMRGSLNAVSTVGEKFCYASERYTYFRQGGIKAPEGTSPLKPLEAGTGNDAPPRTGMDYVALDFGGPITSTRLEHGSAVTGGGAVFFYSGRECFELGFPVAPFIYEREEDTGGGGYGNTKTISYQAAWHCYDGAGFAHRGFPCPNMSDRTTPGAGGPFTEQLRVNTYPGTSKPIPHAKIFVHDEANVGAEIMNPTMVMPNRLQGNFTGFYIDRNNFKGPNLYTIGGYLENVSPEGSAFVAVALNRLMVTGMYSRGRVHYSHKFTPGTAFEDALAPEMNEGLGKLFPDGERGTGISEMDGQAILFTGKSIYGMAGDGPNPTGQIGDFTLQLINGDGGCVNARSVCQFPQGVMFEGTNGIYALLRNHDVVPIGEAVQETLKKYPVISRAVLWEKLQMVIVACHNSAKTDGVLLCYDYIKQRWITWRIAGAVDAFSTTGLSVISGRVDPHLKPWMRLEAPGGHKSVRYALDNVSINFHENKARGFRQADSGSWGLLLEPAATNLVNNQDLTTWSQNGTAVVSSVTLPTGASGNNRITDDDGAVDESRFVGVTMPASATITGSAWGRHDGGAGGDARFRDSSGDGFAFIVDFSGASWALYSGTGTTAAGGADNFVAIPRATGASTGATDFWGMQIEQRAYPTSFIGSNNETFVRRADKLNVDFSYVSVDGYYNFAMTYSPHYAQNETAGDHTLFYIDANNKAIFRKSDSKIVWTVNGVALESSALTFARFAFPTVAFKNGRDERKMILSSFATGNGVVTGAVQGPAPKPAEMVVLGGPSGSEEASALYLFQSNTVPSVPVIALAVHKDILYLATPDGVVLKYDVTTFKDNALGSPQWVTRRVKSSHLQLAQSSWHRCKELVLLMERRTAFDLNVSLYRDFNPAPFQTEVISNAELSTYTDPANKTQPKIKPTRQKGQALQFEISDSDPGGSSSGEGGVWTGVVLRVAPKGGTSKVKKEQRR